MDCEAEILTQRNRGTRVTRRRKIYICETPLYLCVLSVSARKKLCILCEKLVVCETRSTSRSEGLLWSENQRNQRENFKPGTFSIHLPEKVRASDSYRNERTAHVASAKNTVCENQRDLREKTLCPLRLCEKKNLSEKKNVTKLPHILQLLLRNIQTRRSDDGAETKGIFLFCPYRYQ
jgi:hypothetical protein